MATDINSIKSQLRVFAAPDQIISDAIKVLADKKFGLLVVCDDNKKLVGVLSERDVIRVLAQFGAKALDLKVGDVMTSDVKTCGGSTHPHDILTQMQESNIRHMPVTKDGKLTGIVTSRDILEYLAKTATPQEQAMMWAKLVQL